MPTEVKEHEERGHSARYLILIFLVCVATCGVFFSLGFLVGYNEHATHSAPATEVVNGASAVPPTVNPPPDSSQMPPAESASGPAPAASTPETEVIPSEGQGSNPVAPAGKLASPAPMSEQLPPRPAANPPAPVPPTAGNVGEGITLQVAALRTKQDAEALVNILKSRGYPVFMVTPEFAHADDNLYRVQVGPFRTRADADLVHDKLVKEGFKPFIKH